MSSDSLLGNQAGVDESIEHEGGAGGRPNAVASPANGVMGSTVVNERSAWSAWQCQFDALCVKNLQQTQARFASLMVILFAPAGTGLLVELLRGQVEKYNTGLGDAAAKALGGLVICIGVALVTLVYFQQLCGEKQRGLTGAMRLAGLSETAYWASYNVLYLIMSALGGVVFELCGLPTNVPMFRDVRTGLMAFIIFLLLMSMTSLASFWSSFAQRPVVVNLLSFFLFTLVGVSGLGLDITQLDGYLSPASSIVPMLFIGLMPWLSFVRVWLIIAEVTAPILGDGATFEWASLADGGITYCPPGSVDPTCQGFIVGISENWQAPSAGFSLFIMVSVMPIYFVLAWYCSQAFGGEMRQSIIFPFLPTYWGFGTKAESVAMGDTVAKEQLLSRREQSIRCAKLSKAYDQVTALKELTLKLEPNAITCLLGHNGAGKSTLIHTLTGLVNATFGDAVRDEMADIQKIMGICPQHDKLWDELTAEQHLRLNTSNLHHNVIYRMVSDRLLVFSEFYARFKGMDRAVLPEYISAALTQFGLGEEATETVGTFSGGMKRRVSVAVSAMANPSVVYLDEPTTGMDPLHRRQVWDMVQQLRSNRIIVLTTHSMEEADSLGDQIAIMASGKLRALGSSIFLKQKFGRGFQIGLISRPEDSAEVERLVEAQLPGAEIVSASAGNVAISLGKRLLSRVPDFFRALESGELSKYVNEWSLSNTRLEEVFLRLCADTTELNAGGTGDSGTMTFDDLSSLTATEAVDVFNELAWTSELIKSFGADSTDLKGQMVQMNEPSFSSDDGNRIVAELADGEVALGHIVIDERTKVARDKTVGTITKPLIANAVNDGKGTLSVTLPATGLPAAKLCVEVPDGRKIFIEVPMDGTVGEEIFFTAPPPVAMSPSTNMAGVQMEGDELFRTLRDPPTISVMKQTFALCAKQASLQVRQRKSNCCQCCIFFTLVLFGLFTAPRLLDPTQSATMYTPTPFASSLPTPVQATPTASSSFVTTYPIEDYLPNGTVEVVGDGRRRLQGQDQVEMTLISPTMFTFCMATMLHMPKFVYVLIEEKQQRLYHSLRLQGMSLIAYWLGVYVYDFLIYGSFATVFIGLGYVFKVERFMHANALRYIGAAVVFGHSQIGFAVFASSIIRSPKLATVLSYLIIVTSCIAAIVINSFIPVNWSAWLLMVPTLAYPRSIALILVEGGGPLIAANSELGRALWIQAIVGTALFFVGIFLHIVLPNEFGMTESHLVTQFCAKLNKTDGPVSLTGDGASRERDNDPALLGGAGSFTVPGTDRGTVQAQAGADPNVVAEESKVRRGEITPDTCPIVVNDLGLVYLPGLWTQFVSFLKRIFCGGKKRAPKQAVGGVSLSIGKGELFGLLGPNGAGKTSVVNILSGLIVQSDGVCHVGSFNTSSEMPLVHTILGVCPQFDTVWGELTVEEHLTLYARLKGVSSADQRGLVQSVAESIQLDGDPFRQPASQLSGGMLRRLSLGIALIADPQVVLLDEPTTGLDPETRRMVWDIIEKERIKGRCIVLTTHSMEEADTLCTRIGIMTQGKLRSLGTSTELKTRHGQGFRLSFTLKREGSEVDEEVLKQELCPSATLIYSFAKSRVYLLPTEDTDLPVLFEKLVNIKDELGVREWGLSQATLEEAFIQICEESGTK